jgi:hypothetical protein
VFVKAILFSGTGGRLTHVSKAGGKVDTNVIVTHAHNHFSHRIKENLNKLFLFAYARMA